MQTRRQFLMVSFVLLVAALVGVASIAAQGPRPEPVEGPQLLAPLANLGTGFTYQGQLKNGGAAVNGACDFQFALYDALTLGARIGVTQTVSSLTVANGLFATLIDFGTGAFTGDARFLNMQVRCPAGGGAYIALTPRQTLTPSPLALALPGLYTTQNITSPNLIGGYSGNVISSTVVGGTIGGGGQSGFVNRVTSNYATVGGGTINTASGAWATVGGGGANNASNQYAAVGGGTANTAGGQYATIGGGSTNSASTIYASVGGGDHNTADGDWATVSGGASNLASDQHATVGGGVINHATAADATVGGGTGNVASGAASTIPGGSANSASGDYSFAAGRLAHANNTGSFVWSDSTVDTNSTANYQFIVHSSGGIYLYPASGSCTLNTGAGGWACSSDRSLKENFKALDTKMVLQGLSGIPILRWNSLGQDAAIQHVGPMAQDFYAAFGLGEDNVHINTVDAQGVAFAAIQGLNQIMQEQRTQLDMQQQEIAQLKQQVATLQTQNTTMDTRLAALEQRGTTQSALAGTVRLSPVWLLGGGLVLVGTLLARRFGFGAKQ